MVSFSLLSSLFGPGGVGGAVGGAWAARGPAFWLFLFGGGCCCCCCCCVSAPPRLSANGRLFFDVALSCNVVVVDVVVEVVVVVDDDDDDGTSRFVKCPASDDQKWIEPPSFASHAPLERLLSFVTGFFLPGFSDLYRLVPGFT